MGAILLPPNIGDKSDGAGASVSIKASPIASRELFLWKKSAFRSCVFVSKKPENE
jgi:hypothetical protein